MTTVRITVNGETITGELNGSPPPKTWSGNCRHRHLGRLQRRRESRRARPALTMDGVPAGADPEINDIGYYRPTNGLVFYDGDVGYFNGIVRIGELSASPCSSSNARPVASRPRSQQADAVP